MSLLSLRPSPPPPETASPSIKSLSFLSPPSQSHHPLPSKNQSKSCSFQLDSTPPTLPSHTPRFHLSTLSFQFTQLDNKRHLSVQARDEIDMGIVEEMDMHGMVANSSARAPVQPQAEEELDLRRGPWTVEEDLILVNYIANHGEGRWNSLARCAGLKRTGKSCRLRWLNYLRPDVRRGNITPEEQLLILELHSRWGNRWSKIAQQLPGRTDNEIKNYWRTRVQKHAKQLKCDVNSKQFKDIMRYLWMPRLMERIRAASVGSASAAATGAMQHASAAPSANPLIIPAVPAESMHPTVAEFAHAKLSPDNSCRMAGSSSDVSVGTHLSSPRASDVTDCYVVQPGWDAGGYGDEFPAGQMMGCGVAGNSESLLSPYGYFNHGFPDFEPAGWGIAGGEFTSENLCVCDDLWLLQQHL